MPLVVKTPHTGSGTSFIVPCDRPPFVSLSCEGGILAQVRRAWHSVLFFSSHIATLQRPFMGRTEARYLQFLLLPKTWSSRVADSIFLPVLSGVYMRPRQSYPVFAAWGGQAG